MEFGLFGVLAVRESCPVAVEAMGTSVAMPAIAPNLPVAGLEGVALAG